MTRTIVPAPIRRTFRIEAPPQRAFAFFTSRMGEWWLPTHSVLAAARADIVIEPREGGRWYEIGIDGSQCEWGSVALWDPPARLVLIWRLTQDWKYDASLSTEIELTFERDGHGTRVSFEHRGLESYGVGADAHRERMDAGWGRLLDGYSAFAGGDDEAR